MNARKIFGRPWGEIPLPLRLDAVISLLWIPYGVVVSWSHPVLVAFLLAFTLWWTWILLRGSRIVWTLAVGFTLIGLIPVSWLATDWWWVIIDLIDLVLLLWPSTCRYVWRRSSEPTPDDGRYVGAERG